MIEKIRNFFTNDRTFKGAITLYQQYGNRLSVKKMINVQPESDYLKGIIFDDLREMAGISHTDYSAMINAPIVPMVVKEYNVQPAAQKKAEPLLKAAKASSKPAGKKGKGKK